MKPGLLLLLFASLLFTNCSKDNDCEKEETCFKGRLEIKRICGNYTIKLLKGNLDPSKYETTWTDPHTGIQYQNVFGVERTCGIPPAMKQGDEFYFRIVSRNDDNCVICLAFYPTPAKKLAIEVLSGGCDLL